MEELLGELMAELGVSDEQFVEACRKAESNPIHKKIVDQIMAVDSFLAFKRLMVKRNQELNRQAVEMYERAQKAAAAGKTAETPKPAEEEKNEETKEAATAAASGVGPDGKPLSKEEIKKQEEELKEVMRLAHSLERAEEEEMMKRALEESNRLKSEEQKQLEEEEEMIKRAIAESEREAAAQKSQPEAS